MTELPMIMGPCPECGSQITHRQVYISKQERGRPKEATLRCSCGWMNSIDISGPIVPSLQSALNPVGRESDPPDRPNGCLVGPAVLLAVSAWMFFA